MRAWSGQSLNLVDSLDWTHVWDLKIRSLKSFWFVRRGGKQGVQRRLLCCITLVSSSEHSLHPLQPVFQMQRKHWHGSGCRSHPRSPNRLRWTPLPCHCPVASPVRWRSKKQAWTMVDKWVVVFERKNPSFSTQGWVSLGLLLPSWNLLEWQILTNQSKWLLKLCHKVCKWCLMGWACSEVVYQIRKKQTNVIFIYHVWEVTTIQLINTKKHKISGLLIITNYNY